MSTGINTYARLMLGLKTRDNSGAFRCYRVSKLAEIDFDRIRSRGYSFQEEILFWCQAVGCRFGETPIVFKDRRAGMSKINMREAASALGILFQLGVARRTGSRSPSRRRKSLIGAIARSESSRRPLGADRRLDTSRRTAAVTAQAISRSRTVT